MIGSTSTCPTDDELAEYAAHPSGSETIAHHLDGCARCRNAIAALTVVGSKSLSARPNEPVRDVAGGASPGDALQLVGVQLDHFRIVALLGRGAMGIVYRAEDARLQRDVALKVLPPSFAEDDERRRRFLREARAAAAVSHPNIAAVHEVGSAGRRIYIAMELVEGHSLTKILAERRLPLEEAMRLARQILAGLTAAHQAGLVHRDLKPGNVMIAHDGAAKLLDFGLAKRLDPAMSESAIDRADTVSAITEEGRVLGTPAYMSPEQVRGAAVDVRSDVFSFGVVLYEMLAGRRPFVGSTAADLFSAILRDPPAPLSEQSTAVSAELSRVVERCLAKEPGDRYQDCLSLMRDLDRAAEGALDELKEGVSAPSFAEREHGLLSLVIASPPLPSSDAVTVVVGDAHAGAAPPSAVRRALAAMGLSVDSMADGSLVVRVQGAGSATDQAAHAARAALVVKDLWPVASVALATGRGAVDGPSTVGEIADRAIRLMMQREPSASGVWVDELSARLLGPRFALAPSPEGMLLTREEKDADAARPLLGKPTPCVGREAELGSLEAQIAGCVEASEARAVIVTAPPGIGKSRLRHELLRRIEARGEPVTLLGGRGDAMSAGAPYGILAAAIRGLAGVGGGEPLEEQRRLLRARVGQHLAHLASAERERVVRFVGELCAVPFSEEGMPMLQTARHEPRIMGDCVRRAVLDWLAAECAVRPVLVVLDDLQWGDALTVSVMDQALGEQAGTPFFVLALARPEVHEAFPRLWHGHKMQEIVLRGLSRKACERLIVEVLGTDVPQATLDRAVDQSAGNALFLEELIRSIAEGTAGDQPETVVAMLQARIARFPAGPRRALRAASVFGRTFWGGSVSAILGLSGASVEVTSWLSELVDAELIQPSPTSHLHGEQEHGFRHALMRDAAYGLLTASDLATGHRRAGEFLEAAGEHDAAVVAEHFARGGDLPRAAAFYLRAAEESLPRADYAGAQRLCARALGCAPEGEVLGRLKSVMCYAGLYLDSLEGTGEAALSALTLLRPGSLGWCRAMHGAVFAASNAPAQMLELLALLGSTDPEPDARVSYVEAVSYLSPLMANIPEPMIQAYLDRLASSVDSASESDPAVRRYFLAARGVLTLLRSPRPWSGTTDLGEALRLAHEVGDRNTELAVQTNVTEMGWLELGDLDGARRRMLAQEERFSQSQEVMRFAVWVNYLVRILCELPEEQALQKADALMARALSNTRGMLLFHLGVQGGLARVALVRGQLEKAEELSRAVMEALSFAPVYWTFSAPVHVHALIRLGRADEACLVAEQVTSTLRRLGGAGSFEVEARLAAAEAFEANGDRQRARTELEETLRQIKLRADDVTDPFWRESYLTRNPHCARALALGRAWGANAGDLV